MKINAKQIVSVVIAVSMLSTTANAFDIKLVGSAQKAQSWYYAEDKNTFTTLDTTNIGLEIGHYKNTNLEGFGFGWHVGVSMPTDSNALAGETFEVGIAPGYSITKELVLKAELGVGLKTGRRTKPTVDGGLVEDSFLFIGPYYGGSVEYVIADHYVLGAAAKAWIYTSVDSASKPTLIPEVSVAYRF